MFGLMMLLIGIVFLIIGSTPVFPVTAIAIFAPASLVSNAADDKSNWGRFQLTMPVKRKHIVLSRYVVYLIFLLMGIVLAVAVTAIGRLLHEMGMVEYGSVFWGPFAEFLAGLNPRAIAPMLALAGIGTALIACSLYYPLAYSVFKGKEEGLSLVVLLFSLALSGFIGWLGFRLDLSLNGVIALSVVVPAILFVISCLVSVKIYEKNDV